MLGRGDLMSDPTQQLAELKEAYRSGVLTVAYEGKSSTFRNLAEMQAVIASLEREISGGSAKPGSAAHPVLRLSKGW